MNLILFYDTETTGLPLFKEPSEHPDQPHIVQLAAALVDTDTRKTVSSIDVIIKPVGWTIPEEMTAIHGISNELANDVGVDLKKILPVFLNMASGRLRVAHNQSFDARMIRIAQHKLSHLFSEDDLENWKTGLADCTQKMATTVLKLPPTDKMVKAGFNKYKPANLRESYRHFFGVDFENAHSAMADVNACIAVYFAIKDLESAQ